MKAAGIRRSSPITVRSSIFAPPTSPARSNWPKGVEMVMPGDNVSVDIELIAPVAMEKGQRFAIREGGRTIGAGRVSDIVT